MDASFDATKTEMDGNMKGKKKRQGNFVWGLEGFQWIRVDQLQSPDKLEILHN